MHIRFGVSDDGSQLVVKSMSEEHNHEISEVKRTHYFHEQSYFQCWKMRHLQYIFCRIFGLVLIVYLFHYTQPLFTGILKELFRLKLNSFKITLERVYVLLMTYLKMATFKRQILVSSERCHVYF